MLGGTNLTTVVTKSNSADGLLHRESVNNFIIRVHSNLGILQNII